MADIERDGIVLKARNGDRKKNLEAIADEIDKIIGEGAVFASPEGNITLDPQEQHRIKGYMEQLRIIADEWTKAK